MFAIYQSVTQLVGFISTCQLIDQRKRSIRTHFDSELTRARDLLPQSRTLHDLHPCHTMDNILDVESYDCSSGFNSLGPPFVTKLGVQFVEHIISARREIFSSFGVTPIPTQESSFAQVTVNQSDNQPKCGLQRYLFTRPNTWLIDR